MELIGPLQTRIMHAIWRDGLSSVHEVHDQLSKDKSMPELAYTTVLTVMRNLVRRGILNQQKPDGSRSHTFVPTIGENEYKKLMLERICKDFFNDEKVTMTKILNS